MTQAMGVDVTWRYLMFPFIAEATIHFTSASFKLLENEKKIFSRGKIMEFCHFGEVGTLVQIHWMNNALIR